MGSELGERLRRERLRRRLTQEQAAARFGVSQPSLYRWESGENRPSDEHFAEVGKFLGVSVGEVWQLVHEAEEPTSLDLLRAELKDLQREVEDLRRIRDSATEVAEIRAEIERLKEARPPDPPSDPPAKETGRRKRRPS